MLAGFAQLSCMDWQSPGRAGLPVGRCRAAGRRAAQGPGAVMAAVRSPCAGTPAASPGPHSPDRRLLMAEATPGGSGGHAPVRCEPASDGCPSDAGRNRRYLASSSRNLMRERGSWTGWPADWQPWNWACTASGRHSDPTSGTIRPAVLRPSPPCGKGGGPWRPCGRQLQRLGRRRARLPARVRMPPRRRNLLMTQLRLDFAVVLGRQLSLTVVCPRTGARRGSRRGDASSDPVAGRHCPGRAAGSSAPRPGCRCEDGSWPRRDGLECPDPSRMLPGPRSARAEAAACHGRQEGSAETFALDASPAGLLGRAGEVENDGPARSRSSRRPNGRTGRRSS